MNDALLPGVGEALRCAGSRRLPGVFSKDTVTLLPNQRLSVIGLLKAGPMGPFVRAITWYPWVAFGIASGTTGSMCFLHLGR